MGVGINRFDPDPLTSPNLIGASAAGVCSRRFFGEGLGGRTVALPMPPWSTRPGRKSPPKS